MTLTEASIKSLVIDIETVPAKAHVWGLWDQNVGLSQLISPSMLTCFAAKWAGSDEVYFSSEKLHTREGMVYAAWDLLDEADELIGFNSNSFDIKHLNAEFMLFGLPPPSPYKKIDLMRSVKDQARFMSNKLAYLSDVLKVGAKIETGGFELWLDYMQGKKEAMRLMREYNEEDVLLTERLYDRLRPWITTGVNRSAVVNGHVCPTCGGSHLHSRGTTRTLQLTYRKYQCQSCGGWSRAVVADEKSDRKNRLVNIK